MESLIRFAADGLLLVILFIAGVAGVYNVVFVVKRVQVFVPYAIMASLSSLLIAKLLSMIYQPETGRPYIELGARAGATYIDNPGFPSDHALLATVVVLMLMALTPYKRLSIILGVLTVIMSVARVLALVHTPLDVLGGILVGTVGAVWYLKMKSYT